MLNLKNKLPIIVLIMCVLSIFLVRFTYLSLFLCTLSIILCLLFSRKKLRIMLITIVISLSTIFTNCLILYKEKSTVYEDLFRDINVLLGNWNYNLDSSAYIFNDDYSFIRYDDVKNMNDYCSGSYKYNYGGTGKDGDVIYTDDNYYYYDLELNIDFCIFGNNKKMVNQKEYYVFGINSSDYNDLVFIDSINDYAFKVTKILD